MAVHHDELYELCLAETMRVNEVTICMKSTKLGGGRLGTENGCSLGHLKSTC